ncbi:MAG: hypothetical protein IJW70_03080 [Clostridia bacterium]|nr:hypothetical protein [Clostridia bacterium]
MTTKIFTKENFAEMDSMHDSVATHITIENRTLVITYDNLDQNAIYISKKLTIEYEIDSYCDVRFFKNNKYKFIDLLEEKDKFCKLTKNCTFMSYKYAVDCFREITLEFTIQGKNKYWCLEISMDPTKITYHWE